MSGNIKTIDVNKLMANEESFNLTKVAPNKITLCDESDNEEVLETVNLESRYGSKQSKRSPKGKAKQENKLNQKTYSTHSKSH